MTRVDHSSWPLTPSQQRQLESIYATLMTIHGRRRPFLLTGDTGVGKTFLARRLISMPGDYYNVAESYLPQVLAGHGLSDLTPEAVVRSVRDLIQQGQAPYAIVDGLEPLVSMWAVERPKVLPNFFAAFSRVVLERPSLIVVRTVEQSAYSELSKEALWPAERCFLLELTLADKQAVARNWGIDPVHAHVSANLYELLQNKLKR